MERLEKRNEIRISYQIEIINILRKGRRTITEIANILGVSFTAISHIVDDLIKIGLVKYTDKQQLKTRGRNPVLVELNCNQGVVCSVDFSSFDIRVVLSTLDSNKVIEDTIPNVKYLTKTVLEQIEALIKKLLEAPEVKGRKLLSICIASPGLIRPDNFEFVASRRIKDNNVINPVTYLTNAFNVKVEMHNEVRLGCLAEMKFGVFPKKPFNGLFIHIGFYSGLTPIINGKIFKGSNGFSGETPVFVGDDEIIIGSRWNTCFFPIWEIERAIHRERKERLPSYDETVDLDRILNDYKNGDPITVKAVEESAKRNAMTIFGLATILDLDCVVIEGKILEFGSQYLDLMRKDINDFSPSECRTRILVSGLKEECQTLGASYQASSIYMKDLIESTTRERFDFPDYKLNEKYREL